MKENELRKKIIHLNDIHLNNFKVDLFDETINLNDCNIDYIKLDIEAILNIIPIWIERTSDEDYDIIEYYNKLEKLLKILLSDIKRID